MMVHMKLFKSSGSHLADLTNMLDEADRTAEAQNSEISCFISWWTQFFQGSKSKLPCHQCETDLLNHRLLRIQTQERVKDRINQLKALIEKKEARPKQTKSKKPQIEFERTSALAVSEISENQFIGQELNSRQSRAMAGTFADLYPSLEVSGKQKNMFKSPVINQFIKEAQNTVFGTVDDLSAQFVDKLDRLHRHETRISISGQFYELKVTPQYVHVKCGVSSKCRFQLWFSYLLSSEGSPVNIQFYRTINLNHCLD